MSTLRVDTILGESGAERRGLMTYAIICDQKAAATAGGTFTSGAWQTRELNTTIADPDSIVSIANDQFTLQAGSYFIESSAPAYHCDRHQTRLYNATASSVVQAGQPMYCSDADNVNNFSNIFSRVTLTSSTAFEIQHRCEQSHTGNGFGVEGNFGESSIYTVVKIYKEA